MTDRLAAAPPRDERNGQVGPAGQKDADAYRTIGEVAEELGLPQHVLRFWETRFPQVRPLKRAGGRRFYRPEDVDLLRAVQALLYGEGYTIKGVQRLLADHGARQVADALARSRAPQGTADAAAGRLGGSAARPAQRAVPVRVEPVPAPLDQPEPRRPEPFRSDPAAVAPTRAPARGGALPVPDAAARMAAILADLAECARLLDSVRST